MMSKKRIALIISIALCGFIFLLLKSTPANWVLAHAANQTKAFVPMQVRGTIWQGKAANIVITAVPKPLVLGKVTWNISPWSLLTGVLSLNISAKHEQQKASGDIRLGLLSHNLSVSDFSLAFDAAQFSYLSPMPVNYEAFAELTLQSLSVKNIVNKPQLVDLSGNLLIKNVAVNFGSPITLGTFGLRLSTADKTIEDEAILLVGLSDVDAVLEVNGKAELLPSTQDYWLDLSVKPTSKASPMIMQTLSQFYKRQSDGSYQINMGKAL